MNEPLRLTEPIAPQLFAALRQAIAKMNLRPGDALSEQEVAARFGVSRQPVREAFIKLSEAGLVEIRPSRGTFVKKISVREVANARFVREAIEVEIARSAARLATPPQIAALHDLIAQQRDAAARGDFPAFNDADETYHRSIAAIVDNDYAWRIVEAARFQTDRVRMLAFPDATPLALLIAQHEDIARRLETGDAEGAAAAMARHLREILRALSRIARDNPGLFSDTELPEHTQDLTASTA